MLNLHILQEKLHIILLSSFLQVQNVWLSEQEHLRQFLDAADWFMDNQDDNGGWPSQVSKCLTIWLIK